MDQIFQYQGAVRSSVDDFIAKKQTARQGVSARQAGFRRRLQPFATSGKLLRGCLVCYSYEAFSDQKPDDTVLQAATALELAHSAMLIHDDIMDDDDLRRGQASMHRQYQLQAIKDKLPGAKDFGTSMALGGGDMAMFWSFGLLTGTPKVVQKLFSKQMSITCAGQMQDIYLAAQPEMPSKQAIEELMASKTAAYTFSLPLAMGAALAGQAAGTISKLQDLGVEMGIIFQIRDDELGVLANTEATGKPVGSDITEGKKTLLAHYLLRECSAEERERLRRIFGNAGAETADIAFVQDVTRQRRVPKLLDDEIKEHERKTEALITDLSLPVAIGKALNELVKFCSQRQF